MKLEALQSLSVAVMIVGLFLSTLGGLGAYFFSGGSERAGRPQASAQIEMAEPELPVRDAAADARLASIVEPVAEVTAKQLSLIPESTLPPIPEKQPTPADPAPTKKPVEPTPAAPIAKAAAPASPAPKKSVAPTPAPVIAKAALPENLAALPPVGEKLPEPPPVKSPALAKAAAPEVATSALIPARSNPDLGIEPWQKEKLLQRLRTFQNGSIALQVPQGNEEAMGFATALKDAFLTAGWHVTGLSAVKMDRESPGLTLSSGTFPPPTEVTTVFSALISAGIKLSTELDPAQGKKHATLFIGSRP